MHSNLSGLTSDSTGLDTPHFGQLTCVFARVPFSRLSEKSDLGDTKATGKTSNILDDTTPKTKGISRPKTYNAKERPPRTTTVSIVGTLARLLVIAIPKPRARTSMKTETMAETKGE